MRRWWGLICIIGLCVTACNDGTQADELGIGAQCASDEDCAEDQQCLAQFKGGYCGLIDCARDEDCPEASSCITHDDGKNYCFRQCAEKTECNENRDADFESNCSSNITRVDPDNKLKACIPPSA